MSVGNECNIIAQIARRWDHHPGQCAPLSFTLGVSSWPANQGTLYAIMRQGAKPCTSDAAIQPTNG